jgi:hypothetical protein
MALRRLSRTSIRSTARRRRSIAERVASRTTTELVRRFPHRFEPTNTRAAARALFRDDLDTGDHTTTTFGCSTSAPLERLELEA